MKRRGFLIGLAGTAAAAGWAGWRLGGFGGGPGSGPAGAAGVRVTRTGWALGTEVRLTVFHPERAAAEEAIADAFAALDRVEAVMSLYRPESELVRLNTTGRLASPHPSLVRVLRTAAEMSERTGGVFDVTVQPLYLLHQEHARAGTRPTEAELAAVRARVDWRRVGIADDAVELRGEGTAVTLNGLAQGFAADEVGRVLAARGIASALIDTGEIGTLGGRGGPGPWSVGIKHPRRPGGLLEVTGLQGRCLATSGDYETAFTADFAEHHLLDPRTGHSPRELASVSVVAPTALVADALSTAVFLLGPVAGHDLVAATPGADALFVTKDGRVSRTAGFPAAVEV